MDCLKINSWTIETQSDTYESKDFRESIFSQGNGYMGVRGYSPESSKKHDAERSTLFAGFYEYIRPGITDIVNQPDFSSTFIRINDQDISLLSKTDYCQRLNMKDGSLNWSYIIRDCNGQRVHISITRIMNMENIHTAAIRYEIKPLDADLQLYMETGIDGEVLNLPIADNQLNDNIEFIRLWETKHSYSQGIKGGLSMITKYSKYLTAMEYRLLASNIPEESIKELERPNYTGAKIDTKIRKQQACRIDKLIGVACYRDNENPELLAAGSVDRYLEHGFDGMLQDTENKWRSIWELSDILLEASEELQGAVRFNIFQLIQSDPANDPYASIGARGLMHGRYKGCYFWDTEIFMLPYFVSTNPNAAKNLLLYRCHTLKDAIASAKAFSVKGARYSWMASNTGFEQCETWDTGCCEIHITADIAYAMGRYIEQTKDDTFLRDYAAEIYIQTARYWADRFNYDRKKDEYNLLFVKGPDEYCGVTMNNFYTVKLAVHNLNLAINAIKTMEADYTAEWDVLKEKISFQEEELLQWAAIINKAVTYYDETRKLWLQDATFELLEPIDIVSYKEEDIPLYHKLNFDRLQRYQVLKQADVLMYMALFPKEFPMDQLKAAWDFYEPKTLHDSTLSFGIHAVIAARLGLMQEAEKYLYKSLFLDLKNIMNNTAREGIHTAALGASWQALIFGYAGLWADEKEIACKPNLPEAIKGMKFKIHYRGSWYEVRIKRGKPAEIYFLSTT